MRTSAGWHPGAAAIGVDGGLTGADRARLYRRMHLMRCFEECVAEHVRTGEIHGEMHLAIGQESTAAVLQDHLRPGDAVVSTHRAHLHALAAGVPPVPLLAELVERDGLNHGKGGHMHLFDATHRFMCTGIVGASAPQALGYALAQQYRGEPGITVSVAGDAAINQGTVYESMNIAAVRELPVLFLVENNDYGISVHREQSTAGELHERGQAMGIPGFACDGHDIDDTAQAFAEAFDLLRDERTPVLLVADVDRFRGHYEGDTDHYRSAEDKQRATSASRDPLLALRSRLIADGTLTDAEVDRIDSEAADEVTEWDRQAHLIPFPDAATATLRTFSDE